MEHPLYNENNPVSGTSESPLPETVPPKPEPEDKKGNVWVRSLTSLALYIALGYYFFSHNWLILLILTAIVIFHELGHFFAMKMYDYKELGIFFIPLLGAYASGTKREVSQKQSAIILLAGPLPGIIVGIALYFLNNEMWLDRTLEMTAILLVFLNLLNLLPIYPLDGGQLLNRLFFEEYRIVGKVFIFLSIAAMIYFAWKLNFYVLLIFPFMLLMRMRTDSEFDTLGKKIEEQGINLDTSYEDLSDKDYWKIRNVLIENNHAGLRNLNPSPPYEYSDQETKVVSAIESLLQRSIIQDLSVGGKLLILVIWLGCFAAPFLLELNLPFIKRF